MKSCIFTRFAVLLGLSALLALFAACSGGGGTTVKPLPGGDYNSGGNGVPGLIIDGPTGYEGQQPPPQPDLPIDPGPVTPTQGGPFDFGKNIFSIPLDTNGTGRMTVTSTNDAGQRLGFSPGQKVAFVVVNLNPAFLDAHVQPGSTSFPVLPQSSYTISADLVTHAGAAAATASEIAATTEKDLGTLQNYKGMNTNKQQSPLAIYEREAVANGQVPFAASAPAKTTSSIQKGEIRTFINVEPAICHPPIPPGEDNPDQDTSEFRYPRVYNSQDGRLVAIGAHCLVFLSTEINYGHPDTIQYTEERLNRMAREFDTKIFPTATNVFGPVKSYEEYSVWRDLNREVVLTGDDFGSDGQLTTAARERMTGDVDAEMWKEKKIIIFVYNGGGEGGFFTWFQPDNEIWTQLKEDGYSDAQIRQMLAAGSAVYIGAANFPADDDVWDAGFSVIAHEFQHKLYHDHDLPERNTSFMWFNEGLSMLSIHACGYTVNSGKIISWAIDGQLTDYLTHCNTSAVPMDANPYFTNQTQYGSGFLFFLYLFEHYGAGIGRTIYGNAEKGEHDYIKLIESATQEPFAQTYAKFAVANFIDGIYKDNATDLFDPRFHYSTINLRGTVNLASGTVVLPGVRTSVFPEGGSYPITSIDRLVYPWATDYMVFTNGDSRDLQVTLYTDPNFKVFMLPVNFDSNLNSAVITQGVNLTY